MQPLNDCLQASIADTLEKKKRIYPQHTNRISSLGEKCLRKLAYMRLAWDKQKPIDNGLQGIFETGNQLEPVIEDIVANLGRRSNPPFRIVGKQSATRDLFLEKYNITGTIDGVIEIIERDERPQRYAVVDIKTCSPFVFKTIHTKKDLEKFPWTKKYIAQLTLYALAENLERCVILFVNKTNLFDMRMIEFDLDMEYAESLIQKAEAVNAAVTAYQESKSDSTLPDRIADVEACTQCQYQHVCNPPLESTGNMITSADEELLGLLHRRKEVIDASKEYDQIQKTLKAKLVAGQDLIAGPNIILWTKVHRKSYTVEEAVQSRMKILDSEDGAGVYETV